MQCYVRYSGYVFVRAQKKNPALSAWSAGAERGGVRGTGAAGEGGAGGAGCVSCARSKASAGGRRDSSSYSVKTGTGLSVYRSANERSRCSKVQQVNED
jgi:hypothetical protein